jgi:sulfate adenylyltransferase subunit 1
LEDEIDTSRGSMLSKPENAPSLLREISAQVCWMDQQKLVPGKAYLLQHGINRVKAKVQLIEHVIDVTSNKILEDKKEMGLNDIGKITLKTAQPVFADSYDVNPANGAFILIDEFSNSTVAVGFVN